MKLFTIIDRYIFKQLFIPFLICISFFSFVFLMISILQIMNLIVNYKMSVLSIIMMLLYNLPFFLEFIIPMSVMMAVLLTFLQLSGNNEITALKAGGVSPARLLRPVIIFCAIGCFLTAFMAIYGLPWGRVSLKQALYKEATSFINMALKERTWNDKFRNIMLYVNKIDMKTMKLTDIFIEDQKMEGSVTVIIAPEGQLISDSENLAVHLILKNGIINNVTLDDNSTSSSKFNVFKMNLSLKKSDIERPGGEKDEEEMSIPELLEYLEKHKNNKTDQYWITLMEYHKKFSLPFACLALGFLGMPLGIQSKSAKRSFGIGLGLLFFLIYYILLATGFVFGEAGKYPPLIGMWVPNLVLGSIGIFLFIKTLRESTIGIDKLINLFRFLKVKKDDV